MTKKTAYIRKNFPTILKNLAPSLQKEALEMLGVKSIPTAKELKGCKNLSKTIELIESARGKAKVCNALWEGHLDRVRGECFGPEWQKVLNWTQFHNIGTFGKGEEISSNFYSSRYEIYEFLVPDMTWNAQIAKLCCITVENFKQKMRMRRFGVEQYTDLREAQISWLIADWIPQNASDRELAFKIVREAQAPIPTWKEACDFMQKHERSPALNIAKKMAIAADITLFADLP